MAKGPGRHTIADRDSFALPQALVGQLGVAGQFYVRDRLMWYYGWGVFACLTGPGAGEQFDLASVLALGAHRLGLGLHSRLWWRLGRSFLVSVGRNSGEAFARGVGYEGLGPRCDERVTCANGE